MNTTIDDYRRLQFRYGLSTMLIILMELERLEMYEECGKVFRVINTTSGDEFTSTDPEVITAAFIDCYQELKAMTRTDMSKGDWLIHITRHTHWAYSYLADMGLEIDPNGEVAIRLITAYNDNSSQ